MTSKFYIGQSLKVSRSFSPDDLQKFSELTGDRNPIHLDPEYAAKTFFKYNIVHGLLLGGVISGMIASKLPGEGTIYLSQNMSFKAPVFVNETVEFIIEIISIREDKNIIGLKTIVRNKDGKDCMIGEALVKAQ